MHIEWAISIGGILTSALTLLGFVIAALGFFYALRLQIERSTAELTGMKGHLVDIDRELKELAGVVVAQAVIDTKISALTERVNLHYKEQIDWQRWTRDRIEKMEKP